MAHRICVESKHKVTTCLEKLEMSGNLTAVSEMPGILLKVREVSWKSGLSLFIVSCMFASIIIPPPGGIKQRSASVVCLSDVAYIGSNSKTKRPRKTKLCIGVPQVTCDSHTNFKVKSQGHGRGHIVAAT